jgi:hypothetical protein
LAGEIFEQHGALRFHRFHFGEAGCGLIAGRETQSGGGSGYIVEKFFHQKL